MIIVMTAAFGDLYRKKILWVKPLYIWMSLEKEPNEWPTGSV